MRMNNGGLHLQEINNTTYNPLFPPALRLLASADFASLPPSRMFRHLSSPSSFTEHGREVQSNVHSYILCSKILRAEEKNRMSEF